MITPAWMVLSWKNLVSSELVQWVDGVTTPPGPPLSRGGELDPPCSSFGKVEGSGAINPSVEMEAMMKVFIVDCVKYTVFSGGVFCVTLWWLKKIK